MNKLEIGEWKSVTELRCHNTYCIYEVNWLEYYRSRWTLEAITKPYSTVIYHLKQRILLFWKKRYYKQHKNSYPESRWAQNKRKYGSYFEWNFQSHVQSLRVNTSMEMQKNPGGNYPAIAKLSSSISRIFWPPGGQEYNLSQHAAKRHYSCRSQCHPVSVSYWVNKIKMDRKSILGVHRYG